MKLETLELRPLLRPLLAWIAGIITAVYCPNVRELSALLPCACLLLVVCSPTGRKGRMNYAGRGLWGAIFLAACFSFALLYTDFRLTLPPSPLTSWQKSAAQWQAELVDTYAHLGLTEKEESVLATLVLGYRESMERALTESFTAAGVVHILSVSGFHVAVLYTLLSNLFARMGTGLAVRSLDAGATLGLVWGFTIVSGWDSPTVRSALMITFYVVNNLFYLRGDPYNTWAASALLMLVYNPFYLFDIGFQLSYIAVWSILFFYPRFRRMLAVRHPLLRPAWEGLALTLAAQVGTLPLCLYYFRETSWVFLFTALPVSWLCTVLIPVGLLWVVLGQVGVFVPFLGWVVAWCVRMLIYWVEGFGRIPMLRVHFNGWMLLASYVLLFALMLYWMRREKKAGMRP